MHHIGEFFLGDAGQKIEDAIDRLNLRFDQKTAHTVMFNHDPRLERIRTLSRIMDIEHEVCGEERWGF